MKFEYILMNVALCIVGSVQGSDFYKNTLQHCISVFAGFRSCGFAVGSFRCQTSIINCAERFEEPKYEGLILIFVPSISTRSKS